MNNNQLPYRHDPSSNNNEIMIVIPIEYAVVNGENVFTYDFSDYIHATYWETDYDRETIEAEFTESITDDEKPYYLFAASSGLITGTLSSLDLSFDLLMHIDARGIENLAVQMAKLCGCKEMDYNESVAFFINAGTKIFTSQLELDRASIHDAISSNPTLLGLITCLLTQFTGNLCYFKKNGEIVIKKAPRNKYVIGDTNSQKVLLAFAYWLFELALTKAKATNSNIILEQTLKKHNLNNLISDYCDYLKSKGIPTNEDELYTWYAKFLKIHICRQEVSDAIERIAASTLAKFAKDLSSDALPVILNECLIRGFYFIRQLILHKQVDLLHANNRILSHMGLISSSIFVLSNVGIAIIKNRATGKPLFTEINVVGIGRLIFAIGEEFKYWKVNIHVKFSRKMHSSSYGRSPIDSDYLKMFQLTSDQAQLLHNLEYQALLHDIRATKKREQIDLKDEWLQTWKQIILSTQDKTEEQYFINDATPFYNTLYECKKYPKFQIPLALIAMELTLFKPYVPLGHEKDKQFSKLKQVASYVDDVYLKEQTSFGQEFIAGIRKNYDKYYKSYSGRTEKTAKSIIGTVAVTALTATAALTFAPAIAVVIAGKAVAGLSGAALVNASLAYVGFGSLATGGLGMAGGTAIITGGGALLGLATSAGTAAFAGAMENMSATMLADQFARLTITCEFIPVLDPSKREYISQVASQLYQLAKDMQHELDQMKSEKSSLNKELIKNHTKNIAVIKKAAPTILNIYIESFGA